jgi:hypothetical protein
MTIMLLPPTTKNTPINTGTPLPYTLETYCYPKNHYLGRVGCVIGNCVTFMANRKNRQGGVHAFRRAL